MDKFSEIKTFLKSLKSQLSTEQANRLINYYNEVFHRKEEYCGRCSSKYARYIKELKYYTGLLTLPERLKSLGKYIGRPLLEADEETQKKRIEICKNCEYLRKSICIKCGCVIENKAKDLTEVCPKGKW